MNLLRAAQTGAKAFPMRWSGVLGQMVPSRYGGYRLMLPQSGFDYEAAIGDLWRHSLVWNGLKYMMTNLTKPDLVMKQRKRSGQLEILPDHELIRKLSPPNPFWTFSDLLKATILSLVCNGNSYWLKARRMGGVGEPLQYWWVPHWQMEPGWPADGSQWISHYTYVVDGYAYRVDVEDVVHFKGASDPNNPRKGMSDLQALMREIYTDTEATVYQAALLRNSGIPGFLFTPTDGTVKINAEDATKLKHRWQEEFTGEGRGTPFIPSFPIKVEKLGMSPQELVLRDVHTHSEERVAGALNLPAICLSFGAGLERSTFSNTEQAEEMAWNDCLVPMGNTLAETLDLHVLPDFPAYPAGRFFFGWDYREVPAMQEDRDLLATRAKTLFRDGGIITRAEARIMNDYETTPEDERYVDEIPGLLPGKPQEGGGEGEDASGNGASSAARQVAFRRAYHERCRARIAMRDLQDASDAR